MKYKKNFEKYTPFATSAYYKRFDTVSRKGEHWTLSNSIFRFGKKFGACIKNILVFQLIMSRSGRNWTGNVRGLTRNTKEDQNKSFCDRYFWRWLQSWKGVRRMNKTRAEPERRLDDFEKWAMETIANSRRESGTGSPPQRVKLTSKKLKRGEKNE